MQGLVGLFEGKLFDAGLHGYFWRQREKVYRILARQVRHLTQHAFPPQNAVGKARNIRHMDTTADDDAALAYRA